MTRQDSLACLCFGAFFCISSGVTNYAARNDLPIRLPRETVDYFVKMVEGIGDVVIHTGAGLNLPPPGPEGPGTLRDELFVVHYPPDKPEFGKHVLEFLRASTTNVEQLFGGRSLAKGLAGDQLVVRADLSVMDYEREFPDTDGVCVSSLAPAFGGLTVEFIALNPRFRDDWRSGSVVPNSALRERLDVVLEHELVHVGYNTWLARSRPPLHPHWVVEGIADYGARDNQLAGKFEASGFSLDPEAPDRGVADYWVGYTAHRALECWKGRSTVQQYAANLLSLEVPEALAEAAPGTSIEAWERTWRDMANQGLFDADAKSPCTYAR